MRQPLVSVIMPTRNRARFVGAAIDSVLRQTLGDLELLIVDDASSDDTPEILAARSRGDRRIRLFRLPENGGDNLARNRALREARGRYTAFLDDDDIALPARLERTVARLKAEPALGVVTTGFRFIDVSGRINDYVPKGMPIGEDATDGARVFELLYCDWAWMPTCTVTLRAELIERHRYPEVRRCDGDSIFHCLLALSGASLRSRLVESSDDRGGTFRGSARSRANGLGAPPLAPQSPRVRLPQAPRICRERDLRPPPSLNESSHAGSSSRAELVEQ